MIERNLLDKRSSIFAEIPPFEDEYKTGNEGGGAGQRHVELRRKVIEKRRH